MAQENEYSKEALDILGKIPNSFIRYGLSVFFVILTGIIIFLYSIKYPDVYQIPIKILPVSHDCCTHYVAYGEVAVKDIGKIEKDALLSISLNQYPTYKYGALIGQVDSIFKPITSLSYIIRIELSDGLHSTLGQELRYTSNSEGIAEFKGKQKSFFQRIFSSSAERN